MSGNSPRSSKRFGSSVKGIHRKKRRRHRNKMLFFEPLEGRIAPGSMLDLLVPPAIAGLLGPEEGARKLRKSVQGIHFAAKRAANTAPVCIHSGPGVDELCLGQEQRG
jgi:hypothetical protein